MYNARLGFKKIQIKPSPHRVTETTIPVMNISNFENGQKTAMIFINISFFPFESSKFARALGITPF